MTKWLLILLLGLFLLGLLSPMLRRMGLGRLPGDLRFRRGGRAYYFPFTSSVMLSIFLGYSVWIAYMNKAFVKESDADDDEDGDDDLPALTPGGKNYMTPAGYTRMKAEFDQLWKGERPRLVETISWAASNGDRSENGDYIYGKKRLREIDRRIRYLSKRLDYAEVVDPAKREETDQVFFGATVTVSDAGAEETYAIVGLDEADPGNNRISWVAPLARALLKAREGDIVTVQSPGGSRELEIREVRYLALD